MPDRPIRIASLSGTRAQIVALLRKAPITAREIAVRLGLTYHAVRPHLLALERDGLVRAGGVRQGTTRPSVIYEVTQGIDSALSRMYAPYAAHLTRALGERFSKLQLAAVMRTVGRRLAEGLPHPHGTLRQRVVAASALLHDLGGPNEVRSKAGTLEIRAFGCVLADAVRGQPAVCGVMQSLLAELLDADVRARCDRGERPRCCFEVRRASSARA